MRSASTRPVTSIHSAGAQAARSAAAKAIAKPADQAGETEIAEKPSRRIRRRFVICVALEAGVADLICDRHAFHRACDEHEIAFRRHDQ
jgi:hypothetical protein